MTRKRSLALTILVIIILALECCGVLVDKQPIDPENHTLGDSLFLFMYSNYLLPAVIGFLCGVFEIIDRPVFEGKKGVLKVILAYLRLTLALIFNMVFWAAYTRSQIPIADRIGKDLKVPHIGWNSLEFTDKKSELFKYISDGDFVYFVHSYYAADCEESVIANAGYGAKLTAAVQCGNVYGCQFHPEKSGKTGLNILRAFCEKEE